MSSLFLHSVRVYLTCWAQSFFAVGRGHAPLTPWRLLVLLVGFPVFLLLQLCHWAGWLLDEVMFRSYKKVAVEAPLFITGVPRSGTTFVHRALARDAETFTTFRTWHALFAPSITERRFWKVMARVDRALGGFFRRAVTGITRRLCGGFSEVHEVGLDAPEEDYLALLPAAGAFILVLAFPHSDRLWRLARLGDLPGNTRRKLLRFYHQCLQKHLHEEGPDRRLLSKNAAFGSWVPELQATFPGARYLVCLREPQTALASQLSSLAEGRRLLASDPDGELFAERFRQRFSELYRDLRKVIEQTAPTGLAVIDQGELREAAGETLAAALAQLQIALVPSLREALGAASRKARSYRSAHRHRPTDRQRAEAAVGPELQAVYEAMRPARASVLPASAS